MSKPALRLFQSHDNTDRRERELDRITGTAEPKTVAVPLGKVVPLLMDAVSNDRAWLSDFAEDTGRIDAELYDVLLAYQQIQSRAA